MTAVDVPPSMEEVLAAGGEMGRRIASLDWARTPLGPLGAWPQSVRTAVGMCLGCRFPAVLWLGADRIAVYNDDYADILGVRHPGALGEPARKVWGERWQAVAPGLTPAMDDGESSSSQNQLWLVERGPFLDERYFTFSHQPLRDERGTVTGVLTVIFETTSAVVGERRLMALRELAEDTMDARAPEEVCEIAVASLGRRPAELPFVLLYLVDEQRSAARLTGSAGVNFKKDVGKIPRTVDLLAGEDGWGLKAALDSQALAVLDRLPGELSVPTAVGRPPERAIVLPVREPGERPTALLVLGISPGRRIDPSLRDFCQQVADSVAAAISKARRRAAEARAEALVQLDRDRTAFFSNVSHEFRTPLTLLLGPIEDALRDGEEPLRPVQRERIDTARRSAVRLLDLVDLLLEFSRLEEGRLEPVFQPLDLGPLTAELARGFQAKADAAGLRLAIDCPPIEPVYADRSMWEYIVVNLVSNALKFTSEGEVTVRVEIDDGHAVLEVSDTGIGIPADQIARIFERFHRVSPEHEGTGIGLAVVQELVEAHHGWVEVFSTEGQGSRFRVCLPSGAEHLPAEHPPAERIGSASAPPSLNGAAPAPSAAPPQAVPAAGTESGRIFLVDDHPEMLAYVGGLLRHHWHVQCFTNGPAALEAARRQPPDLVLTDVMMPGLDGFGLLRSLRDASETARIPVVMLSARAGEEASVQGLDAGADDYLVKPFSARDLLARVRVHLEMARARELARQRADEYARLVKGIATASAELVESAGSVADVLDVVTTQAAELIGAHQAMTSLVTEQDWDAAINHTVLSPKYAEHQGRDLRPVGGPLYDVVCRDNLPIYLTEAALERHPGGRQLAESPPGRPPLRGWLAAPMLARDGRNLGIIQLSDKQEGDFDEQDQAILFQYAMIATVRLKRALREARVQQVSETLQHSLQPASLPRLEHAEVAARYLPATRDLTVGGDWYEVLALPDGRIMVAIGDVVGHDEQAAAATSQLRNALRAYALEGLSPAAVLGRLNLLGEALNEQHFSTVACLCLDPRTGLLQYANAGHPPPILLRPDRTTTVLSGAAGVPIGAVTQAGYADAETSLDPGAVVVLYTDGLVESRERGLDEGLAGLASALAEGSDDLEPLLAHVLQTVPDAARDDDLAVVALRALARPVTSLELRLPAEVSTLRLLRKQVRDFLKQAGAPETARDELLVAVSEAAANAIQHPQAPAEPYIEITMTVADGEVVVVVRDFGKWKPRAQDDEDGKRGQLLMKRLATSVETVPHQDGTTVTVRKRFV